jgi:AraC-like DNA-binding protein
MAFLVRTLACTYFGGHHIEPHRHPWGQLVYAASGVMRVRAGQTLWIVPPARAVWAPADAEHEIWARGDFAMRTLYLEPALAAALPPDCRAIDVAPLLRELILHIVGLGMLEAGRSEHERLAGVLKDRLVAAEALALSLPLPADRRCRSAAEGLIEAPSQDAELEVIARRSGASARTLQRLFLKQTGMGFAEWRQRLRLLHGAGLVGSGVPVTEAGLEAGYASTSAFSAAFRRQFGRTPSSLR